MPTISSITPRSSQPGVRNPLLLIPEVQALALMSPEARSGLEKALLGLSRDFRNRGNEAWRKHKAPIAAYWKSNAVHARHLALAIRKAGA